uniref:Serine protease n=1 Tax=Riboviria sp. TaxID=2585031 RepID=A0A8K1U4U2_9VIRU|nr:MAG: hypothetical protein 2 [Riboviria sp.]
MFDIFDVDFSYWGGVATGMMLAPLVWFVQRCMFEVRLDNFSSRQLLVELYTRHQQFILLAVAAFVLFHSPYYFKILRWFFRLPKKYWKIVFDDCVTVVRTIDPVYVPEKYVAGSDYRDGIRPAFQVAIYASTPSKTWEFRGEGWRVDDNLVTARHVVSDESIVYRIMADERFLDIDGSRFERFDFDLATIFVPIADWATLGVKRANLSGKAVGDYQVASCYSRGKISSGVIHTYQSMPHIVYDGSTRPGCSGAPLFVGSTVYGLHLGAGKVNLGLDATWVSKVIYKAESSEDAVLAEIVDKFTKTGRKTVFKTFEGDDIYLLSGGKYYTFDFARLSDDVREALDYESSYTGQYANESVGTFDRADSGSVSRVARNSLNVDRASVSAEARKLKADGPASHQSSQVNFALSDSVENPLASTSGLGSILAQLKKASESIVPSPPESRKESRGKTKKSRRPRRRTPSQGSVA